jgi:hypothetical protein
MAPVLQCPDCGTKHPIDVASSAAAFRCNGCGRTLKVPEEFRPAAASAVAPDPARTTSMAAVPPARAASANGGRTLSRRKVRAQAGVVPFWTRLLIWIVAVPVSFIVVFGLARAIGFLSQSQLEDVFLETGWNRFWPVARLLPFTALLTAGIVQFAVLYFSRWRMRHALGPLQPHTAANSGRSTTAAGATGSSDAHTPSA